MFQIVTQRCKNPENSRQQRILTPSTKEPGVKVNAIYLSKIIKIGGNLAKF